MISGRSIGAPLPNIKEMINYLIEVCVNIKKKKHKTVFLSNLMAFQTFLSVTHSTINTFWGHFMYYIIYTLHLLSLTVSIVL